MLDDERQSPEEVEHVQPPEEVPVEVGPSSASGPSTWDAMSEVFSIPLDRNVTFVRLGGPADFVYDGSAKIKYSRIKPGKVRAMQTSHVSVDARTLRSISSPKGSPSSQRAGTSQSPGSRKSPRLAEEAPNPRAADLPPLASHERSRKLPLKKEAPVRGHQQLERTTKESKVIVEQRCEEFPNNSLCKDPVTGRLRCAACGINITNLKQTISTHCNMGTEERPSAHARELLIWRARAHGDDQIKVDLVQYFNQHPNESVGTKDADALLYRYHVAESFVKTPPFLDKHRPLLQRAGHSLPESQNLSAFIPKILKAERILLDSELEGQHIGIGFDGTTRLGEAINTTGRWCDDTFHINMRLLDFTTLAKHVNNIQLAAHEVEVTRKRGIPASGIVNVARDSVAVNGVLRADDFWLLSPVLWTRSAFAILFVTSVSASC